MGFLGGERFRPLIVEEFAGKKFAAICAAFAVTLPMGILQSTSTQNDYVVSFWLLTFVLFTIRYVRTSIPGYAYALGLSLGLAILTKAIAYIFALPFCVILRWQPWESRLLLPYFLLMTPAVGLMPARVRARYVAALMIVLLMAYAVPFALFNNTRPLLELTKRNDASYEVGLSRFLHLGRHQLYMMNSPDFYEPYKRAAVLATSNNCRDVGLLIGGNTQEYPLWSYLRQRDERVRMFHIDVTNVSAKKSKNRDTPCAIVATIEESRRVVMRGDSRRRRSCRVFVSTRETSEEAPLVDLADRLSRFCRRVEDSQCDALTRSTSASDRSRYRAFHLSCRRRSG